MNLTRLSWGWRLIIAATLTLLFVPIAVIVALSFNESKFGALPFEPTLKWYEELLSNSDLFLATVRSLELSIGVALTVAVIGTGLALWMARRPGRGAMLVNGGLVASVAIPWLILGVSLLNLATATGLGRGWPAMYLGSLVTSMPYAVLLIVVRLRELDPSMAEAAESLGARQATVIRRILIPLVRPAILGGSLMGFTICFNNFVIQYLLAPFGVRTLPLEIFTLVRTGYQPDINALSTVILVFTLLLILVLQRLVGGLQRIVATEG